jgi:hypothetical protein
MRISGDEESAQPLRPFDIQLRRSGHGRCHSILNHSAIEAP